MTKIKPGLGRGLDAIFNPVDKKAVETPVKIEDNNLTSDDGSAFNVIAKIPTDKIRPNPYQPRAEFDKKSLEELQRSILENGLIQPITVRRTDKGIYELISGERRFRAFSQIGYKEIPAYIIQVDSKEAMVALSLIENIQREQLNAIEVASAYKQLFEECNLSHEEISERVGKDRTTVTNTLRLLKLPKEVQSALIKDEISAGHARALINLSNIDSQIEILHKIISEQLSVRKVELLVKRYSSDNFGKQNKNLPKVVDKKISIYLADLENRLRGIFGTKVICKQKKDGSGEVVLEYYSKDELERLIELFDSVENPYS